MAETSHADTNSNTEGNGGGASAAAAGSEVGRSLVVDEAFFEEQFLRCQVCHERFELNERSPKSLPCNHTFCFPCLTQIFDHAQPTARRNLVWPDETLDGTLKCPTCRVEIFLSRNKIKELPNDHRVVQMMDFLTQAVAKSQNVCSKHDRQPLSFFCQKCLVPVCRDCTVLDHKETEGHIIVDMSKAISENSNQFNNIEKKSRETLEKMKSRSDSLANASKRLDMLDRRLKNEIKETFIEYRLLLEKRQEALTSMVDDIVKEQKSLINSRFVNVCEHGTQLQKFYDEFKASRKSNDIRKLFTIQQQMIEHENKFAEVASCEDNELFKSCEFDAQNEGCFLSDLSSLGEVTAKEDLRLKEPIDPRQLVVMDMEKHLERQRLISNHLAQYECDDEELARVASRALADYDNQDSDENTDPSSDDARDVMVNLQDDITSRLITRYAERFGESHTRPTHEHDQPLLPRASASTSASRRSGGSRRGRRTRDTNSSQVSTSIAMDNTDAPNLHRLREALSAATSVSSSSSGGYPRSSARQENPYRVVRHQAGLRHQTDYRVADDSN